MKRTGRKRRYLGKTNQGLPPILSCGDHGCIDVLKIHHAFPDKQKRQEYIKALLKVL